MGDMQDDKAIACGGSSWSRMLSWTVSCLCLLGLAVGALNFGSGASGSRTPQTSKPELLRATPVLDACLVKDRAFPTSAASKLVDLVAVRYRLVAEREGASRLRLPAGFDRINRQAARIAANEQRIFDVRKAAFDSRQRGFRSRIQTVQEEMEAFEKQKRAKEEEIALIRRELQAVETMHARQLANMPRLLSLKREVTRAQWDVGSIDAALARSRLAVKEIEQDMQNNKHEMIVDATRGIRNLDIDIDALADERCVDVPGAIRNDRARDAARAYSQKSQREGTQLLHQTKE